MDTVRKIHCLIIDDEFPAREVLKRHIQRVEVLVLAGECANAVDGISFLQKNTVDLIFLDIQMPQLLGTGFIRTLKNPPHVIFTTAFRKYAIEGFELDAVDYILKPISFERFLKAVNKVLHSTIQRLPEPSYPIREKNLETPNSFLYFRVDRKMVKVLLNDILFIEALKDYIKIITTSGTLVTKHVLSTLENLLPSEEFLRIHKSYIVAINKIESYNSECIGISKTELPIGRSFKVNVFKILGATPGL